MIGNLWGVTDFHCTQCRTSWQRDYFTHHSQNFLVLSSKIVSCPECDYYKPMTFFEIFTLIMLPICGFSSAFGFYKLFGPVSFWFMATCLFSVYAIYFGIKRGVEICKDQAAIKRGIEAHFLPSCAEPPEPAGITAPLEPKPPANSAHVQPPKENESPHNT